LELSLCCTPPTEIVFFGQASGRQLVVPRLLMLCVRTKSASNSASSTDAEIDV
jgi:hypothetical protein